MSKNEVIFSTRISIFHLARRYQCSICIIINFYWIVINMTIICWNQHGKNGKIWENISMKRNFIERFIIQQSFSMFIFNLREKSEWKWMSYRGKWKYFIWNDRKKIWEKSSWIKIEWCEKKSMRWWNIFLNWLNVIKSIISITRNILKKRFIIKIRLSRMRQ